MSNINYIDYLKTQFNNTIQFVPRKKGVNQIFLPFFHEDGDMFDVFIEETEDSDYPLRICDYGLTLMHLSYKFDIDTDHKKEILNNIITQNLGQYNDGNIYIDTTIKNLYQSILQYYQLVSKVSNISILRRENIKSLFYENFSSYIESSLSKFHLKKSYEPVTDYYADYCLGDQSIKNKIFVFGVKDSSKAKDVLLSCAVFKQHNIPFESLIVYEDIDSISIKKIDRRRLTNIADKQFSTLDDFKEQALEYLNRKLG